ncbi:hypothetical protein GII30_21870 [Gordonia amarae]|uniref:Uncharacterized protein n=2 Tax=Gordonia amarae TaxID=36821 RepID=G7GM45_9ACTN|nr:hypothetical protein [Gordonia amarae]MCS3876399.1 hypothetical protein [Gordonia amarae]QHN19316.1 hypothetical protein GII35_22165 [Gordonia amarae]QHN23792.1 hypothetical protein GII34_21665 [Gordonia amarae]QHN32702.1 hypothetical protein GII32_21995 [Gordonia amarae]QHN41451.1 hypothetical protein GII30_21870 [Gordonia amarae]
MTQRQPTPPDLNDAERSYLQPVGPQFYPPLGYTDDGTPQYLPGQQSARPSHVPTGIGAIAPGTPAADDLHAAPGPVSHRAQPRQGGVWKAAVYLVVIAVLGAATILMARNVLSDGPEEITLPSVDTSDTWITDTAPPYPTVPDTPTKRGATVDSAGKSVVYQATINGVGVLAYSDDTGTRTDVISEPEWKVTFTGTGAPLRLLVVATSGSSVSCAILVDGQVVAHDDVSTQSSRRTAACLA